MSLRLWRFAQKYRFADYPFWSFGFPRFDTVSNFVLRISNLFFASPMNPLPKGHLMPPALRLEHHSWA
jgi:hypothetical protein